MGMSYTDDELILLAAVPQMIGTAVASASANGIIGTGKELFANASGLAEGAADVSSDRNPATAWLQKVRDWIAAHLNRVEQAFDHPAAIAARLSGRKILITAGPTHEPIDADHFIGRHDTGQLGYRLAEAAVALGSETVLVSGPAHLPLPQGAQLMPVTTATEMLSLCERELPCDIAICAAAVSKWRLEPPAHASNSLQAGSPLQLSLTATPDIAKALATRRDKRPMVVVGCSTERENVVENGRAKFRETGCDLILVEDASPAAEDLISDRVTVHLVAGDNVETWSRMDKGEIARRLMEVLAARLAATSDLHGGP
jgi:phosphopantothenoylcysteine decarboxylase/phosphopantothenate--cysteine ligase